MQENDYQKAEKRDRIKEAFARFLEIINFIILPLQYITKDIFLLFSSYNAALTIAIPVLQFICRSLSWVYGVSFILEGLCALIESTKDSCSDKRAFLLTQSGFLIIGGILVTVFAFTQPQFFLPALCVVWGVSTLFFLASMVRDFIKNAKETKMEAQLIRSVADKLHTHVDDKFCLDRSNNLNFLSTLNQVFREAIEDQGASTINTTGLKAEIMERIEEIQDKNGVVTKQDIDNITQTMLSDEKYNPGISRNVVLTTTYLVVSFCCALASFIFFGRADIQQSAIFVHVVITTGMVVKRCWDFITNPIIFRAQFEKISSKDMDQLKPNALKEKYLKLRLEKLRQNATKLIDHVDKEGLQKAVKNYATIVDEINPDHNQNYRSALLEVANIIADKAGSNNEALKQIASALEQSVSSRLIYLNSNHSCMLCKAIQNVRASQKRASRQIIEATKSTTLKNKKKIEMLQEKSPRVTKHHEKSRLSQIAEQCSMLLSKNKNWKTAIQESEQTDSDEDTDRAAPTIKKNQ